MDLECELSSNDKCPVAFVADLDMKSILRSCCAASAKK